MRILIIEDDKDTVEVVANILRLGFPEAEVTSTAQGHEGVAMAHAWSPDLIILDLGLPDMSGFDVLEDIRKSSSCPVLILSVREDESDIVKGLNLGADEYVTKPFRKTELLARVKALMRRQEAEHIPASYGPLHFGSSIRDIQYGEHRALVSVTEGRILHCLIAAQGEIVPSSTLAKEIWGTTSDSGDTLKTYIHRLRRKLALSGIPPIIATKPGIGYYIDLQLPQ